MTADELLEIYRVLVDSQVKDDEDRWVVSEWDRALRDYRDDPALLSDRMDWVAKQKLLQWLKEEEGLSPGDPWFQSLDLAYHDLDEGEGMFWPLEGEGSVVRMTSPENVKAATVLPPKFGRPPIRAAVLNRFHDQIRDAGWERVAFVDGTTVDLPIFSLLNEEEVRNLCARIGKLEGPSDLLKVLSEWIE